MAMAHRGRLNVLMNVLGQSPEELFQVFDGTIDYGMTSGDVKYHRGYSSDVQTPWGSIHLSMAFNPSHLEYVNSVATGSVRAKQDRFESDDSNDYALLVLMHGDAAFVGEGVVMEGFNMSKTHAYDIGGVLHIVTNNQVGFTTSVKEDVRTSHYCTGACEDD